MIVLFIILDVDVIRFNIECYSFKNISSHEEKYFGRHLQAVNMSLFKYFTQLKDNTKSARSKLHSYITIKC